jgi:hypothetical protein
VQLGGDGADAKEQQQPPLEDTADPGWAHALLADAAGAMAAAAFAAVRSDACRVCPVRRSCPAQAAGAGVVGLPAASATSAPGRDGAP